MTQAKRNTLTRLGTEPTPTALPSALPITSDSSSMAPEPISDLAATPSSASSSSGNTTDTSQASDFPKFVHEYIRSYISLADQKASFVFVAASSLLAYVSKQDLPTSVFEFSITILSMLLFFASAIFSFLTIFPRLKKGAPGVIFWKHILNSDDATTYANRIELLTPQASAREITLHSYALAWVCNRKYTWLQCSMVCGATGFFFFIIKILLA